MDLDQGGQYFQKVRIYLGPTLGATEVQVQPQIRITVGGTTTLNPGNYVVLVDAGPNNVTIQLPDVAAWMKVLPFLPGTDLEAAIWIKDLGGNARTNNIVINPFGSQTIDKLPQLKIIQTRQLVRLYPLTVDLSGWVAA